MRRPITGSVPNVIGPRCVSATVKKCSVSEAPYDMATYINPEAIHIVFCRVNILKGQATCSITEYINTSYSKRGRTRRVSGLIKVQYN